MVGSPSLLEALTWYVHEHVLVVFLSVSMSMQHQIAVPYDLGRFSPFLIPISSPQDKKHATFRVASCYG
jgi:hypothetical protein